jgi:hypothetical protein
LDFGSKIVYIGIINFIGLDVHRKMTRTVIPRVPTKGNQMKASVKDELIEHYFRDVKLIGGMRETYGLHDLTPVHEALLEFIGQAWQDDKPLSVRKLMAVSTMASTVTIHR